jgi:hypothetical protein
MTSESSTTSQHPEKGKSRRYSRKSAGRSAWMKQLHAEKRAGPGAGKVDHGQYALDRRLHEGLDPDSAMARHHAERRAAYASVLGGVDHLDEFQLGLLDRIADNDVSRSVIVGSRSKWLTAPMTRILRDIDAFNKNGLQFLQLLKAVRESEQRTPKTDTTIVVRRWSGSEAPAPSTGQEHEQGGGQ